MRANVRLARVSMMLLPLTGALVWPAAGPAAPQGPMRLRPDPTAGDSAPYKPRCAPLGAVEITAGQDIPFIMGRYPAGTVYLIKAGEYRMRSISPKTGDKFYGELGPNGERLAILNGSRLITSFGSSGNLYTISGQTQDENVHDQCLSGWEGGKWNQDLFIDDLPLKHVLTQAQVTAGNNPSRQIWFDGHPNIQPGVWTFDYSTDMVYFAINPAGRKVEIGVTDYAFNTTADNVEIYNLIVEKYSCPPQMGAIGADKSGSGWIVENCEIRLNHGLGLGLGTRSIARGNYIHHNGQLGMACANAVNTLFEKNETCFNNYAHFDADWEAGGSKFVLTDSLKILDNYAHDNFGPGLWTDIDNINTLFEGNVVFHNSGAGIFHEISYAAVIKNNYVGHNGVNSSWLWGNQIQIAASRDVQVYGNVVEVNAGYGNGIGLIQQDRGDGTFGEHLAHNGDIHDNTVIFLGSRGMCGAVQDNGTSQIFSSNHFTGNSYFYTSSSAQRFTWNNRSMTLAGFQAIGHEGDAVYSSDMPAPLDWAALADSAIGGYTPPRPDTPLPEEFELRQNYPNPFNPRTAVPFSVPRQAFVSITLFNVLGRKLETLADREFMPGRHVIEWNAGAFPAGLYFIRMSADRYIRVIKTVLIK